MPKRQGAKMRVLRRSLEEARKAIKTKRWPQARFALGQAGALANALPADQAKQEREQLALLLKRYKGRNTPAAAEARKSTKSTSKPTPAAPKGGKKAATLKSKEPKPSPVRELGERRFDRAAFGYGPADDTTSPDKR